MPRDRSNSPPPPLDGSATGDVANQVRTAPAVDLGNGLAIQVTAYSPLGSTSLSPLVSLLYQLILPRPRPRTPSTASDEEPRGAQTTPIDSPISPVMANTCLPPSSSRLRIHRHSSVASRPRNARGMLRRASGRAERDGARGEASTHSGLRPAYTESLF